VAWSSSASRAAAASAAVGGAVRKAEAVTKLNNDVRAGQAKRDMERLEVMQQKAKRMEAWKEWQTQRPKILAEKMRLDTKLREGDRSSGREFC